MYLYQIHLCYGFCVCLLVYIYIRVRPKISFIHMGGSMCWCVWMCDTERKCVRTWVRAKIYRSTSECDVDIWSALHCRHCSQTYTHTHTSRSCVHLNLFFNCFSLSFVFFFQFSSTISMYIFTDNKFFYLKTNTAVCRNVSLLAHRECNVLIVWPYIVKWRLNKIYIVRQHTLSRCVSRALQKWNNFTHVWMCRCNDDIIYDRQITLCVQHILNTTTTTTVNEDLHIFCLFFVFGVKREHTGFCHVQCTCWWGSGGYSDPIQHTRYALFINLIPF